MSADKTLASSAGHRQRNTRAKGQLRRAQDENRTRRQSASSDYKIKNPYYSTDSIRSFHGMCTGLTGRNEPKKTPTTHLWLPREVHVRTIKKMCPNSKSPDCIYNHIPTKCERICMPGRGSNPFGPRDGVQKNVKFGVINILYTSSVRAYSSSTGIGSCRARAIRLLALQPL